MLSERQAINNADTHCIADEHAQRRFERTHALRDAHPFSVPRLDRGNPSVLIGVRVRRESRCIANVGKLAQNFFNQSGTDRAAIDETVRERATTAREFDPAEIAHGKRSDVPPPIGTAVIPLLVVVGVNLVMSLLVLPRLDFSFLAQERWGSTSLAGVAGVWSVAVALAAAAATLVALNRVAGTCRTGR